MENQNIIMTAYGVNRKIAKVFGVTEAMVTKALKGKGKSDLSKKIRYTAITQYEGKEIQLVTPSVQNN